MTGPEPGGHSARLWVGFAGEFEREVHPGERLTFGRSADLTVDVNPMLHRRLGVLRNDGHRCELANEGSRITLYIDGERGFRTELPSGRRMLLPDGQGHIRFAAGRMQYEIDFEINMPATLTVSSSQSLAGASSTFRPPDLDLTPGRRVLLTALVEPELRSSNDPRPSTKALMTRTGYTHRSIERALDEICEMLDPNRSLGMLGSPDRPARDRRNVLARHVLETGLITTDDLVLLDLHEPGGTDPDCLL